MAGIFTDVSSDIQKLQQLKAEIESVKKALKSINIKVDIDIAKGLEGQLKALTDQYNALVSRISEAEGKILLSTKRINDAAEKIIQAQEKVAKSTGAPAQPGSAGTGTNTVETASIQAQAKAYEELKIEIDDVLGTRDANIKRMVEEMNAIRLINAEINKINKLQGESSSLSSAQQKRLEQLNNSLLTHKTVLSEVRQTLNNNAKLDNAAATSMNGLSQSLSRMRIAYRELTEEERNSPFGKELLTSINQADAKIKELDATIGNHQRNVGNYGKQWDGLSMSIQQIGRELPSLAYGPKVFFSAISNNLPILADEIKRARTQYELLKKSGQSATPVWKQVVSSLLSWQTALTVGITLLTLYGDKLVDWIAKAVKGKNRMEDIRKSMLELNEIEKNANSIMIKTRSEISNVISSLQSFNGTKEQEKRKIDELNSKYGSIFGVYNSLSQWYDILIQKGNDYINSLFAQAKAQAYIQKAIEADQKIRNIKAKGKDEYTPFWGAGGRVYQFFGGSNKNQFGSDPSQIAYDKAIADAEKEKNEALANATDLQKQYLDGIKKAGLFDYSTILDSNQAEKLRKEQEKYALLQSKQSQDNKRQSKDLEFEATQSRIEAMQQGSERTIAQMKLNHQKEIETLKRNREDYLQKKIDAERSLFESNPKNKGKSFDSSNVLLNKDEEDMFKNMLESTITKQGNDISSYYKELLSKYQSYAEKRLAIQKKFQEERDALVKAGASNEALTEHDYQRDETLQSIDNEFAMREESFKAWADNITDLSLEKLRELLVQAEQELQRSEFLNPNNPQLAGQRAKVTSLKNAISEKVAKNNTSPDKRSKKEWQDLYKTLSKVEKEFDEIGTTVGGTAGEIISAAGSIASSTLQMIDGITTLANSSSDAMAGTAQAASKSIQAVEKASVILAIVGAALQITMKMFDLFGGDNTTEKYEKTKETYESYINILDKVIDKQLELAESLSGDNANAAYEKAIELVKTQSDAARVLGKQYLNSGSSWKSHSKGYSEVDDMSWEGWNDAAKALGMSVDQFKSKMGGRMEGLFDLTDEQLEKLQAEAHIFWAQLDSDTQNYANQIAEGVAQVKEVLEQQMTDTTLIDVDTLRNDFHDLLTDMDADSADFADNFEDYMKNAILNSMLKESYMGRLEEWRKKFYAAMDDGVTEQEYNALKEEGQQIADEMKAQRDAMADMFGWESESTSQSSTSKGFQAMSQDTGEELNGRFTALQIAGEEIKTQNIAQTQSLNLLTARADAILSMNTETRNIADDTRNLIAQSYLELVQISENTGNSAKYLKDIKADIAAVKKNTAGLAL